MTHPMHIIATALGVVPIDGCTCAVCGPSPFGVGRPSEDVYSAGESTFVAYWTRARRVVVYLDDKEGT